MGEPSSSPPPDASPEPRAEPRAESSAAAIDEATPGINEATPGRREAVKRELSRSIAGEVWCLHASSLQAGFRTLCLCYMQQ